LGVNESHRAGDLLLLHLLLAQLLLLLLLFVALLSDILAFLQTMWF
jgi:hypothetical protein